MTEKPLALLLFLTTEETREEMGERQREGGEKERGVKETEKESGQNKH